MSTSKGRGAAAHEIVQVIPPEQLRTLFIRPRPNHAIEFDPDGTDAIPRLFDEFDKLADATAGRTVKGELPPGFASVFRYALRDPAADVAAEAAAFRPSFAHLAFLVQVPDADIEALMAAEKGSELTGHERDVLTERIAAARAWLESYAPDRARMTVREALPDEAASLDPEQRAFLAALAGAVLREGGPSGGDAWQSAIFSTRGRARAATRPGVRRPLPRLPRPPQRPAGRLAPGRARGGPSWPARLREAATAGATMSTAGGGA